MRPNGLKSKQQGAIALLTTLLLLILVASISVFSARTVLMEQRITGNQIREKQAFENADAGVQFTIARLKTHGPDSNGNGTLDAITVPAVGGQQPSVTLTDSSASLSLDPMSLITIESTGTSDDGTGSRTIQSSYFVAPLLGRGVSQPLTSRGVVGMTGSADIVNTESNLTIWAGNTVGFSGSGKTYISDGSGGEQLASSKKSGTGLDVVGSDPALGALTGDQFFSNFFNGTKAQVKGSISPDCITSGNGGNSAVNGLTCPIIWVDGDIHLNGANLGSSNAPVVLIVDGDFRANGNMEVHGLVYVTGNYDANGTMDIFGGAIVEGVVEGTGSGKITYRSANISGGPGGDSHTVTKAPGTWRDF